MARHRKLEPIRLEDLENNPCASGLEKVLRFDVPVIRDFPAPDSPELEVSIVSTPVVSSPVPTSPVDSSPQTTPVKTLGLKVTPVDTSGLPIPESRLALSKSRKRLFRPLRPEDAHTDGETRLYQHMWDNGQPHEAGVRIYAGSMTALSRAVGRDDRNTRPVVEALIRKLSIAIARDQDFKTGHPRMYFVFSLQEVASRRRRAGLEWAVKNKGIQLLSAGEAAQLAAAQNVSTPVGSWPNESTPVES